MLELTDRIVVDPDVLVGKPLIKGTRISVEFVLDLLATGWSISDILQNYSRVQQEDVLACITYARDVVRKTRIYPTAA